MRERLSASEARRVALAAQGFDRPIPQRVGTRQLSAAIQRLNLLQIDSVNVFERSHYLPLHARLGAFDKALLDRLVFGSPGPYTEYWAHEASLLPVTDRPLLQWRMDDYRAKSAASTDAWSKANTGMLDWLRLELREKGPLAASEIEHDANVRRGPWWGWSDVKRGLEVLFRWGEVASAGRSRFERRYGLAEQVLPGELLAAHVPREAAVRELMLRSVRAHGVGTLSDFADYYRLKQAPALAALRELEDAGEVAHVTVQGWERGGRPVAAWLHRDARVPRRIEHDALLSPFDPVVWRRERALRLFDFHYRIEIYTPAPRRVYGYYVLPVLLGDRIAARVDLKSDRQAGVLRVQAAWREPDAPPETGERVADLVRQAVAWQGLDRVEVTGRGDLARAVETALPKAAG